MNERLVVGFIRPQIRKKFWRRSLGKNPKNNSQSHKNSEKSLKKKAESKIGSSIGAILSHPVDFYRAEKKAPLLVPFLIF